MYLMYIKYCILVFYSSLPSLFLNPFPPLAAKIRPFITLLMLDHFTVFNARKFYSSRESIWEKGLRLNITSILPHLIEIKISYFSKLFISPQKLKVNLQSWFYQIYFPEIFQKKTRATKKTKQMTISIYIIY